MARHTTAVMLAALSLSFPACTTIPGGTKAFGSFGECMAANAAGVGAVTVLLDKLLLKENKSGRPVLLAAALATVALAWQKCGTAYQSISNTEVKTRDEAEREKRHTAGDKVVRIDDLRLTAGAPGQDLQSAIRYTVLSDDPGKKDIPVKETRIVRIPRLVEREGTLYFADARDQPLTGADGRPIPVHGSASYDPDQLSYADVVLPADVVVRQGVRKADGLLPIPDDSRLQGLPCRFRFEVEAEGLRSEKELAFRFRRPGEAPARFNASAEPHAVIAGGERQ